MFMLFFLVGGVSVWGLPLLSCVDSGLMVVHGCSRPPVGPSDSGVFRGACTLVTCCPGPSGRPSWRPLDCGFFRGSEKLGIGLHGGNLFGGSRCGIFPH